ncbi:hypothetical protein C1H46_043928 [Malus baccata]|uniref:Uncharacterized protein n=1 Tax=Malus baccata TaxID=106549 RepID=A0A540K8H6_MALBA|nr:hypothetical protein C1H46_043928 [Malus baccata]
MKRGEGALQHCYINHTWQPVQVHLQVRFSPYIGLMNIDLCFDNSSSYNLLLVYV